MEKKTYTGQCPKCGKEAHIEIEGDLNSGWSGDFWGQGDYTEGIFVRTIRCAHCNFEDCDVTVNN